MMLYDSIVFTRAAVCKVAVQVEGRKHARSVTMPEMRCGGVISTPDSSPSRPQGSSADAHGLECEFRIAHFNADGVLRRVADVGAPVTNAGMPKWFAQMAICSVPTLLTT